MSGDHNANQKAVGCPTLGEYLRGLRMCQNEMSLERMAERIGIAVAAVTILADTGSEPEAAPAPAPVVVPAKPEWLPAAGNLWPGTRLYFGQHDKLYRGQIDRFIATPQGEAAVLVKDGQVEVMLRQDIAIRDFWVRAE